MTVWVANWPLSSSEMSGSTEQIRTNWDAIEDWWAVEHGGITSATSGAHLIGHTGILLVDAASGISALSCPGTGSLALNTSLGTMQIYRYDSTNSSAGWQGITDVSFQRLRKGFGSQSIPASTWTKLTCAAAATFSEAYDTLSAWSNYKYTIPGPGYYVVATRATWPTTTSDYNKGIAIYKNGSAITRAKRYGESVLSTNISDIVYLTTSDYIEVYVWHSHTSEVTVGGGSIHITRVS